MLLAWSYPEWAGLLIQRSLVPDILHFCIGYALIIAVPGPNTILVATNTAALGFHRTLPLIISISLGAVALVVALGLFVGLSINHQQIVQWMPLVSAVLLIMVACRMARLKPIAGNGPRVDLTRGHRAFAFGFLCGLTNPVTGSYFLSQYLIDGRLTGGPALFAVGLGVLASALLMLLTYALIVAIPSVQIALRRHFVAIRLAATTFILLLAMQVLWRFLLPSVASA
jgi:threonine/homoserine/homoserine lactone efflux protein